MQLGDCVMYPSSHLFRHSHSSPKATISKFLFCFVLFFFSSWICISLGFFFCRWKLAFHYWQCEIHFICFPLILYIPFGFCFVCNVLRMSCVKYESKESLRYAADDVRADCSFHAWAVWTSALESDTTTQHGPAAKCEINRAFSHFKRPKQSGLTVSKLKREREKREGERERNATKTGNGSWHLQAGVLSAGIQRPLSAAAQSDGCTSDGGKN